MVENGVKLYMKKNITLGITGASGIPIAFKLLEQLLINDCRVNLVITNAGIMTIKQETTISLAVNPNTIKETLIEKLGLVNVKNFFVYGNNDWFSPLASGSSVSDAMVVCPCSMSTLGKIANGIGDDLLVRACDVILKERKNLVIVPRETPLSAIHLENMLNLAKIGVSILPPEPAFYLHPKTVEEIIGYIVSRILDQLKIDNDLISRWSMNK